MCVCARVCIERCKVLYWFSQYCLWVSREIFCGGKKKKGYIYIRKTKKKKNPPQTATLYLSLRSSSNGWLNTELSNVYCRGDGLEAMKILTLAMAIDDWQWLCHNVNGYLVKTVTNKIADQQWHTQGKGNSWLAMD